MPRPFLTSRQMALPLAIALAIPMGAMAQTSGTTSGATTSSTPSTSKLASDYSAWAGSTANAQALVTSLRTGETVSLKSTATTGGTGSTSTTTTTSFSPATGKMGTGEVGIALSLAKASLAQLGVTNPTPAQISVALNGGTITTANGTMSVPGVLGQRASGMGWGEIAQAMGVKLGAVVSASKTNKSKAGETHDKAHERAEGKGKDGERTFLGLNLGKIGQTGGNSGSNSHGGGNGHGNGNGNGGGNGGGHGGGGGGGGHGGR